VHLPLGHGILQSETGKPKVYISLQYPILLLQILFMFQGGWNSTVSIVTDCGLDGLGFKFWRGHDFLDPPRPTLRPNQPPVQWILGLFSGNELASVGRWPPNLLVLRSRIQRAIPLFSPCVCLACNGTSFTFIRIQTPYKHVTTIRRGPLQIHAVAQTTWPEADMRKMSFKLYTGSQCQSQNVCLFYSSTCPSQSPL
jgi:hypothetical protein